MTLQKYRSKRDFKRTNEPQGKIKKSASALRFCVQKHAARRLHYDLRLEHKGVLISFAIPKGPSLNPQDKRLAIHVEDHPLEYQFFEGVIPKGNYGAGVVEIWDKGTYSAPSDKSTNLEKYISQGFQKGHFSIQFFGEKLQGEFSFIRLKKEEEWLIIKKEDSYGTEREIISTEKKSPIPHFIKPMLATLVKEPFDDPEWVFEVKWDGFRALAFINKREVSLKSRSDNSLNYQFPLMVQALKEMKGQALLDGEIVVLDAKGKPQFQWMQLYQKEKKGTLCYYVFDILYKDGVDLRNRSLIERKEILKGVLKQIASPNVVLSDHVVGKGKQFFKAAREKQLEGIIGKKSTSTYQSKRSPDWVKIKATLSQEVVIGGFTAPKGSRKKLGALLVGVYDEEHNLRYAGHVGGGFSGSLLEDVYQKLKILIQKTSPFKEKVATNSPATWVKPKLLCQVSFTEWTQENILRHPIFLGLREDKPTALIHKEVPEEIPVSLDQDAKSSFSNLEKIYFPQKKYTKGDLLHYYEEISSFILPYLKNRPIMLHRYPDGIKGNQFYQKDIVFPPKGVNTFPLVQQGKTNHYLLINDLSSLLYAVNLGSIEIHPFMATISDLEHPDYCVIDLDPHQIPLAKVIQTALTTHELLNEWKVQHYCKTSGNQGLHIFIPLHKRYDYTQSRQLAELIAAHVHQELPRITSLERDPKKREKRVYLDCLQNRGGQTIVAPYSVRPNSNASVSTPIEWDELPHLDPREFTIKSIPGRLKEKGDLFKGVLSSGIDIKKVLKKMMRG